MCKDFIWKELSQEFNDRWNPVDIGCVFFPSFCWLIVDCSSCSVEGLYPKLRFPVLVFYSPENWKHFTLRPLMIPRPDRYSESKMTPPSKRESFDSDRRNFERGSYPPLIWMTKVHENISSRNLERWHPRFSGEKSVHAWIIGVLRIVVLGLRPRTTILITPIIQDERLIACGRLLTTIELPEF